MGKNGRGNKRTPSKMHGMIRSRSKTNLQGTAGTSTASGSNSNPSLLLNEQEQIHNDGHANSVAININIHDGDAKHVTTHDKKNIIQDVKPNSFSIFKLTSSHDRRNAMASNLKRKPSIPRLDATRTRNLNFTLLMNLLVALILV